MKINVTNLKLINKENSSCLARCSVILEDAIAVNDIFLMDGKKGVFLNFPQRHYANKDGEMDYSSIVAPITKEAREDITLAVLEAFDKEVAKTEKA